MVESIFDATMYEVPDELKEQANDFQSIIDMCVKYANKYEIKHSSIMHDLDCVLVMG